jgi:hypothetical protein
MIRQWAGIAMALFGLLLVDRSNDVVNRAVCGTRRRRLRQHRCAQNKDGDNVSHVHVERVSKYCDE